MLWKQQIICHLFSTWECYADPIPLLQFQKTMSGKTAEPLLSNTQYNAAVGVWTQIIWEYKVYGFQRLHHDEPMLPKRGEKPQRIVKPWNKAASARHNRNEDHGMDQQRAAGWLCEHTLKKRTQGISQGGSLHNKVGEMKARAITQENCNPLYWKHQLLLLLGLGALWELKVACEALGSVCLHSTFSHTSTAPPHCLEHWEWWQHFLIITFQGVEGSTSLLLRGWRLLRNLNQEEGE